MKSLQRLIALVLLFGFIILPASAGTWRLKQIAQFDKASSFVSTVTFQDTVTFDTAPVVPAGAIARVKLTQEDAAAYPVSLMQCRSNTGLALTATEGAGIPSILGGGIGTGGLQIAGEVANNETETTTFSFEFALPPEYVSGETVTLRLRSSVAGAGTLGATKTIDVECYELGADGTVGSDLCATAAGTLVDDVNTTFDFTITPTGLAAGDRLQVFVQTSILETATADLQAFVNYIAFLLDVKG